MQRAPGARSCASSRVHRANILIREADDDDRNGRGGRGRRRRRGAQEEQHEYLSRLIYIFLLQIFTDKMTRDRIEAVP